MRRLFAIVFLLGCGPGVVSAAEMRSIEIEHADGRYELVSVVWFDAAIENVFHVFSRWDLSPDFSSAVVEARDIEPDKFGRPRFYVRNRGCVLFFCKSLERQGYVELERNSVLRAFAEAEHSDFVMSNETWEFATENGGTVVSYKLLMEPKFWVPPAIGPYLIKRKLKSSGGEALDRIEAMARGFSGSGEILID